MSKRRKLLRWDVKHPTNSEEPNIPLKMSAVPNVNVNKDN